jgi:hypothetical protein
MGETVERDPAGNALPANTTKAWLIEDMLARPLREPRSAGSDYQALLRDCGLVARLKASANKDVTDLAVIRFDTKAELYWDVHPVLDWTLCPDGTRKGPPELRIPHRRDPGEGYLLGPGEMDLLEGMGGWTDIACGLKYADEIADSWLAHHTENSPGYDLFVSILLLSDMQQTERTTQDVLGVATKIKLNVELGGRPRVMLCCAAFGENADLALMRQIATPGRPNHDPNEFAIQTLDTSKLRDFFLASLLAK